MIDRFTSAAATAAAIRTGAVSAVEVAKAALARIAADNPKLNAFTDLTAERALREAQAVDDRRRQGLPLPALAGVPYGVKNLFDVQGLVTRAGSKIERTKQPAARDAFLVDRMRRAGAVLVGAQTMDEYAYGFTTENAHDGDAHNPHDLARSAGGSSGGSAAAVAGGLVPVSLGSDTNGSIRVPSSLCGIFGLKPTYGRLGRSGAFPFVASFDHLGPFARSVADLALAYDALQGPDPEDPAQVARPAMPVGGARASGRRDADVRLAVLGGHFARNGLPEAFAAVARVAAVLGAERQVELPEADRARAAAYVITAAEGANLHLASLKVRADDFDPATRDRFLAGCLIPATWVIQAQRFRAWFRAQVLALFETVDVLIAPATPCVAPRLGQQTMEIDGAILPVRPMLGVYTQPISFIGLPVLVVPAAGGQGLPIGVQLMAAPWREDLLFAMAAAVEEALRG